MEDTSNLTKEASDSQLIRLSEVILEWSTAKALLIVGIAGLPGSGKTTLSRRLAAILSAGEGRNVVAISLDDFYLSPGERQAKGFRWRAVPGTHDLEMLREFLASLSSDKTQIEVPSYDTRAEQRLPHRVCSRPQIVLLDGWLLGARASGYEFVEDAIDKVIFVDMDLEFAHRSRVEREEKIRTDSAGKLGMTAEDTELFWKEALLPIGMMCQDALRSSADIVLTVSESYEIEELSLRRGGAE